MHLPLQIVARHAQLYRDCLRLADYITNRGSQASRGSLRAQVRDAFRKHQGETDPVEIEKQKDAAIRGLSNYMFYEAVGNLPFVRFVPVRRPTRLIRFRRLVGPGVIDGRSWSCGEQLPIDDPEGVTTSSPRSRPSPFRRLERLVRCLLVVIGPLLCAAVAITWAL